jgi:hypothetical protein
MRFTAIADSRRWVTAAYPAIAGWRGLGMLHYPAIAGCRGEEMGIEENRVQRVNINPDLPQYLRKKVLTLFYHKRESFARSIEDLKQYNKR